VAVLAVDRHPVYLTAFGVGAALPRFVFYERLFVHNYPIMDASIFGEQNALFGETFFQLHPLLYLFRQLTVGTGLPTTPSRTAPQLHKNCQNQKDEVDLRCKSIGTESATSIAERVSSRLGISKSRNCG